MNNTTNNQKKNLILICISVCLCLSLLIYFFISSKEHIGGNVLNLPYASSNDSQDAVASPWINGGLVSHLLFRGLLLPDYTLNANHRPDLASSIDVLENGLVYKVNFISGNKWSDGVEITLEDVVYSIKRSGEVANSSALFRTNYSLIDSMEIDENTLYIHLKEPSMHFFPVLVQLAIFPKHATQHFTDADFISSPYWQNPIVSGFYKVGEHIPREYFKLVRNEMHTRNTPKIDEIYLHYGADKNTSLDYYFTNNLSDMVSFRQNRSFTEYQIDMLYFRYLVFNIAGRPNEKVSAMKDIRVRQAICMALDREKILHDVYLDIGKVINGSGEISGGGNSLDYNPELAKELIAQSGYDLDRPLVFGYYNTDVSTKNFLNQTKKYLEYVGFKVELLHLATSDILHVKKDYDFYVKGLAATQSFTWFNEYSSSNEFFVSLFDSHGQFDDLLAQLSREHDIEAQKELYKQLDALGVQTLYKFPLFTLNQSVYINTDRVKIPNNFVHGNYLYNFFFDFVNWEIKKN